jgi:hypothetical protein
MWRNTKLFTLVRLITLHLTVATSYLQSTTIANVTVIDVVRGEVNPDMTIVVTGNRISQLGSSNTAVITDGTRIVDGRGKFIIPGLWDMHVHLGYATEASIPVMISSGITGVRDMVRRALKLYVAGGLRHFPALGLGAPHCLTWTNFAMQHARRDPSSCMQQG